MRTLPTLLLSVLCWGMQMFSASGASLDELESQLRPQLDWLKAYDAGGSVTFEARKEFEQSLSTTIWNISRVLYEATSTDWANPSPERRAVIDRVQRAIAPYNPVLSSLGFRRDGESSTLANQSLTLLKYTRPDENLARALREHLAQPLNQSGPATELLFEHRLLNDSDKRTILEQFAAEQDVEKRIGRALGLSRMGMPEAVPVLAELLSVPFTMEGTGSNTGVGMTENNALMGYKKAIEAIQYLGTSAKPLLPLLKQRMQEIEATLPPSEKQRYLSNLQVAVDQAEGKRPAKAPVAMNSSGPLGAASQPQQEPSPAPTSVPIERLPPSTPVPTATPAPSSPALAPAESPAPVIERKSPVWPWLVGILALVVIVAVALKRRT